MYPLIQLPGCVFALGALAESAAVIYASLTGRRHETCSTVADLKVKPHDVVVCLTEMLSSSLMHKLYVQTNQESVPGLIFAVNVADLESVCIKKAYQLIDATAVAPKRIFLYPKGDFGALDHGVDVFIGGREPSKTVVNLLRAKPALLIMVDRADGFPHLVLSQGIFACPFTSTPHFESELVPICQVQQRCSKLPRMPRIEMAAESGHLVGMSMLNAGIGVIYTCGVVGIRNGLQDPAYSLASALLGQSALGVVITTWRGEDDAADGAHLNDLLNDLSAGITPGLAVGAFNHSLIARQLGIKLCVLGDPCYRLGNAAEFPVLPSLRIHADGDLLVNSALCPSSEAQMLSDAVNGALRVSGSYNAEKGDRLLHLLNTSGNVQDPDPSLGVRDEAMLEFLSDVPWLDRFLERVGDKTTSSETGVCPNCKELSRVQWLHFPRYTAASRQIIHCALCGESSFMPAGWRLSLGTHRLQQRELVLEGIPAGAMASAYLVKGGEIHTLSTFLFSGGQTASVSLPEALPWEPVSCVVLVVHRLLLGTVSIPLRLLANGVISSPLMEHLISHPDA